MHLYLDSLSYTNRLRSLPPEHKLLFALVVLAMALIAHPPVQLVITLWMSIWIVVYARIPASVYFGLVSLPLFFILTSLPALLINIVAIADLSSAQSDIVCGFPLGSYYFYFSQQGYTQAGQILMRTTATVSCVYFILFTVPFTELLQTLRKLGLPTILTELLLLMYRFVFILLSTASELWMVQHSRNGYLTWKRWMYSLSLLITQLFHKTMHHYQQFVLSTAARGFNGEFQVWSSRPYRTSKRYAIEACLGCVVLLGLNLIF